CLKIDWAIERLWRYVVRAGGRCDQVFLKTISYETSGLNPVATAPSSDSIESFLSLWLLLLRQSLSGVASFASVPRYAKVRVILRRSPQRILASMAFRQLCGSRLCAIALMSFLSALLQVRAQSRRPSLRTGFDDVVMAISFSPDGRALAIARGAPESSQQVGRVELWDTHTGALVHAIKGFDGPVWSVSFSPDGRTLVTGSSEYRSDKIQDKGRRGRIFAELKWWDANTGDLKNKITLPNEDRISLKAAAAYSPQGNLLATAEVYVQPIAS